MWNQGLNVYEKLVSAIIIEELLTEINNFCALTSRWLHSLHPLISASSFDITVSPTLTVHFHTLRACVVFPLHPVARHPKRISGIGLTCSASLFNFIISYCIYFNNWYIFPVFLFKSGLHLSEDIMKEIRKERDLSLSAEWEIITGLSKLSLK